MVDDIFKIKRKSFIEIAQIYFWTVTINKWQTLLMEDDYKQVIIDSIEYLTTSGKLDVFGFVIMPNHIHIILRANAFNGKETVQGSLLKHTAHQFKKMLIKDQQKCLSHYKVVQANKQFEFWQRDSLAIPLYTEKVAFQKLDYLHNNPATEYWHLVKDPCDYFYSSAKYYETGIKDHWFLKDLRDEF